MAPVLLVALAWLLAAAVRGHWTDCSGLEDYAILDGRDYRGHVNVTRTGIPCQKWTAQTPHAQNVVLDPSKGFGDHNYCRSPFVGSSTPDAEAPGCYTMDSNIAYQTCNVGPVCIPAAAPPTCTVSFLPQNEVQFVGFSITTKCTKADGTTVPRYTLYYTLDGTNPNAASPTIDSSGAINIGTVGLFTINAFALINFQTPTAVSSKRYRTVPVYLRPPTAYPPATVVYHKAVLVSLLLDGTSSADTSSIRYWTTGMAATTLQTYSGPFWLTDSISISMQQVDAMGRSSDTALAVYEIVDVPRTDPPSILPLGDVFFGGVRLVISAGPRSAIYIRLNAINGQGDFVPFTESNIPVVTVGENIVEAKAKDFDKRESNVVTRRVFVYRAPSITCTPPPGNYSHTLFISCTTPLGPEALVIPLWLSVLSSSSPAPLASSGVNGTSSVALTAMGTYRIVASTVGGQRLLDPSTDPLAQTFDYYVGSTSLAPPTMTLAYNASAWPIEFPADFMVVGSVTVSLFPPDLPAGLVGGVEVSVNGAPATRSATSTITLSADPSQTSVAFLLQVTTVLLSSDASVMLVSDRSAPRMWNVTVLTPGPLFTGIVAVANTTVAPSFVTTLARTALLLPSDFYVQQLYSQPYTVFRVANMPNAQVASDFTQRLVQTFSALVGPATVWDDVVVSARLLSPWPTYVIVGSPFQLAFFDINNQPLTGASGSAKLVRLGQPCSVFVPLFQVQSGTTGDIELDVAGDYDICAELDSTRPGYFLVTSNMGIVRANRAENNIFPTLLPGSGVYRGVDSLVVAPSVSGGCNAETVLKVTVDGSPWSVLPCGTTIVLPVGGHTVSALVVLNLRIGGVNSTSISRTVTERYRVGGAVLNASIHPSLGETSYTFQVTSQETVILTLHAEIPATEDTLAAINAAGPSLRIIPFSCNCSDVAPNFGSSLATTVAFSADAMRNGASQSSSGQSSTLLRGLSEFLLSAPNDDTPLKVCLGSYEVTPSVVPLSMAQIGIGMCDAGALRDDNTTWVDYCHVMFGNTTQCSQVPWNGVPNRMCACPQGVQLTTGGMCDYTTSAPATEAPPVANGPSTLVYALLFLGVVAVAVAFLRHLNQENDEIAKRSAPRKA